MFRTLIFAITAALATPVGVSAATLDIASIGANFHDALDRRGRAVESDGSSIDWGRIHTGTFNSRYSFAGNLASVDSGDFVLGVFEHRNGTLRRSNRNLDSTQLTINVTGSLIGNDFSFSRTLDIGHLESHNEARTCAISGPRPCGDGVDLGAFQTYENVIVFGGFRYRMEVYGWYDAATGGAPISTLFTPERDYNYAYLRGRLTVSPLPPSSDPPLDPPPPVPLPAGVVLLLSALAGTALIRRRA